VTVRFEEEIRFGGSPPSLEQIFANAHAIFGLPVWLVPFSMVVQDRMGLRVTTERVIRKRWKPGWPCWGCLCLAAALLHGQSSSTRAATDEHPATDARVATQAMEREFQDAMAAQDKGDLEHAKSLLLELHSRHPGIFAVDESLGLLYVAREEFAAALPLLEDAARENPSSDVAFANLGAAQFKLHHNSEALQEFQRAAALNPNNSATQQALGRLWMETHEPEKAAAAFAAALAQDPQNHDLAMDRAQALKDAGHAAQATDILAGLPDVDQSAPAQSLLADADEALGNYHEAGNHYARAVELDPSEPNVWMMGIEYLRHWTFEAAIKEFAAGHDKFPLSTRMRLGLGAAYFGNADYARAIPIFADLLDADLDNTLDAELLGLSCVAAIQGEKPRCSSLLKYALSHPRDAKVSVFAASTLIGGQLTDQNMRMARQLLDHAIAIDPRLADAQYEMGVLKQDQMNWTGSISNLEQAVKLKPNFARAHYRLALACMRSGRNQEGEAEMALQKRYSEQQQNDLDQRLRQITTFLVDAHN
jgi:tetratricopeptide (TPR) repeat protein